MFMGYKAIFVLDKKDGKLYTYYIKNGRFFVTDGTSGKNHGGAKNHIYADRLGSPFSNSGIGLLFLFFAGKKQLIANR